MVGAFSLMGLGLIFLSFFFEIMCVRCILRICENVSINLWDFDVDILRSLRLWVET